MLLTNRRAWILALIMIAVATLRIVIAYRAFSITADEPAHIACGMEWLQLGTFDFEAQHPPLARVMVALGPYLAGRRIHAETQVTVAGLAILGAGGERDRNLALARLGILPFFWLASVVAYLWARRHFGISVALLALLFFTTTPAILAHAGLATTDTALNGTLGAAFYAGLIWLDRPTMGASVLLGAAAAATIVAKYSSLAFLPAAFLALAVGRIAAERPPLSRLWAEVKARAIPLGIAAALMLILVWSAFRFSWNGIPAPELFEGIEQMRRHNAAGHLAYLLGQRSTSGFWLYFPVALAVKTPIGIILLAAAGAAVLWRCAREKRDGSWVPLAFGASVLAIAVCGRITIGLRHILPVYYPISMMAAVGAVRIWQSGKPLSRWVVAGLTSWVLLSSAWSHPSYLAYFNAFAGESPERVLVDSDLDWGQDWKRMGIRLRELGVAEVAVDPVLAQHPEYLDSRFPKLTPMNPDAPSPGWTAVSTSLLKLRAGVFHGAPQPELWPERIPPTERVDKSLLLYYVAP